MYNLCQRNVGVCERCIEKYISEKVCLSEKEGHSNSQIYIVVNVKNSSEKLR